MVSASLYQREDVQQEEDERHVRDDLDGAERLAEAQHVRDDEEKVGEDADRPDAQRDERRNGQFGPREGPAVAGEPAEEDGETDQQGDERQAHLQAEHRRCLGGRSHGFSSVPVPAAV